MGVVDCQLLRPLYPLGGRSKKRRAGDGEGGGEGKRRRRLGKERGEGKERKLICFRPDRFQCLRVVFGFVFDQRLDGVTSTPPFANNRLQHSQKQESNGTFETRVCQSTAVSTDRFPALLFHYNLHQNPTNYNSSLAPDSLDVSPKARQSQIQNTASYFDAEMAARLIAGRLSSTMCLIRQGHHSNDVSVEVIIRN